MEKKGENMTTNEEVLLIYANAMFEFVWEVAQLGERIRTVFDGINCSEELHQFRTINSL